MVRISERQAAALGFDVPKKRKYNARKKTVDGITFDSIKEANKYCELKLLQKAGIVKEIVLQPLFQLQAGYMYKGRKIRAITYRADFKVTYTDGRQVVIDVKASSDFQTKEYRIKKKMLLLKYPDINFEEVY